MHIAIKWRQVPLAVQQVPQTVKIFLLKATVGFVAWKFVYLVFLLPGRVLDKPLTYIVSQGTTAILNGISGANDASAANDAGAANTASGAPLYHTAAGVHTDTRIVDGIAKQYSEAVMNIYLGQERVLSIADVCNGLELIVLYAGLILCLPSPPGRKVLFIVGGAILISILNIIRCTGLVLIFQHKPEYLDFSHHYLFSFLVYAFIFLLWHLFSKDPGNRKQIVQHAGTE